MAKCDLTIELENDRRAYFAGDVVRGHVLVSDVDSPVRCNGLTVECLWWTHGKGNRAAGTPQTAELFQGEWGPGTMERYAFTFELPSGPVSYNGHYLNVGWFIRARADVPWALDPKAEVEVAVASDPETGPDWTKQFDSPERIPEGAVTAAGAPGVTPEGSIGTLTIGGKSRPIGGRAGVGCLALLALLVIGPLVGGTIAVWDSIEAIFEGDWASAVPGLIFIGVVLLVLGIAGIFLARHLMLRRRLGEVRLEIDPMVLRPGDIAKVRVFFTPTKATELERATATLHGQERVIRGSGTNRTTHQHELCDQSFDVGVGRQLPAGMPFHLETEVQIPPDAGPSFAASDNYLEWHVSLDLAIARFPDWGQKKEVVVSP